jgi:hypothetical protein
VVHHGRAVKHRRLQIGRVAKSLTEANQQRMRDSYQKFVGLVTPRPQADLRCFVESILRALSKRIDSSGNLTIIHEKLLGKPGLRESDAYAGPEQRQAIIGH